MRAGWIAIALLAGGCVFRNAPEPRFFRPEFAALDGAAEAPSIGAGVPLRLRPVQGTPLLFSAEAPIANETPAATATAMGKALDDAVAAVAVAVGERLQAR